MKYDLEERMAVFGERVIDFCKLIKQDTVTRPLISQLVRSATSVGANYCEANGASSKKDFKNKMHICKKEIQETRYWIRIIKKAYSDSSTGLEIIEKEAQELVLIFNKIVYTLNNSKD
ncbi:four helix bundle protein [Patescibacteria group bacterium]|nr:four helix bundle protein [Patescibacteria group bacterium]